MTITVVIPAFNATWSIGDTLGSLLAQTQGDFSVIVIDDGSTDDLGQAVSGAVGGDRRFRILRQANQGLAGARNRGLAEVRTDLVAFIDSDDIWHPRFLQEVSEALARTPDAPFGYALSLRFDQDGAYIPTPTWPHVPRHDFAGLICVNTVGSGSAAIFRTEAIRAAGGFDPSLMGRDAQGAEDWKLVVRLAATGSPVLVPEYLVGYRRAFRSMSQGTPSRQLRAVRAVLDDLRAEFPDADPRLFRHARTALNGWLFQAFLAKRDYPTILRMIAESYLKNPGWFLNRDLRTLHKMKLAELRSDRGPRPPLAGLVDERGERPFAFLARTDQSAPPDAA